jgi:hypothetical protein
MKNLIRIIKEELSLLQEKENNCCCKYEYINGIWECTKRKKSCCEEGETWEDVKHTPIQEDKEKECCVCYEKKPVLGHVQTGPHDGGGWKWKCCGYKPCSELTQGFTLE